MAARNLTNFEWAKRAGVGEGTLRGFLAGRTDNLRSDVLQKLARAENVPVSEMLGEQQPSREYSRTIKAFAYRVEIDGRLVIEPESGGTPMAWRKTWVDRYLDGRAENGRIIEVTGDKTTSEMEGADYACIHLMRTDPARDPGIYLVWDGSNLHLRRLQVLPNKTYRMLSDNSRYPAIDIGADQAQIIGRCVWRCGGL